MERAARIGIGDPIMSVRSKDANVDHVIEALRRAKVSLASRQQTLSESTNPTPTAHPPPPPTPHPLPLPTLLALILHSSSLLQFKFPGRQKILKSTKWGMTQWEREEYVKGRKVRTYSQPYTTYSHTYGGAHGRAHGHALSIWRKAYTARTTRRCQRVRRGEQRVAGSWRWGRMGAVVAVDSKTRGTALWCDGSYGAMTSSGVYDVLDLDVA